MIDGKEGSRLLKILAIACDNASNNDTMLAELKYLLPKFRGAVTQSRCFAHIINLVVKSILRQFDVRNDKETAMYATTNMDDGDESDGEGGASLEANTEEEDAGEGTSADQVNPGVQPVNTMIAKVSH